MDATVLLTGPLRWLEVRLRARDWFGYVNGGDGSGDGREASHTLSIVPSTSRSKSQSLSESRYVRNECVGSAERRGSAFGGRE